MSESIAIKNFGPISEIVIPELKRVNVFIGASGSGKSTIMKTIAMMQWLYKMQCIRSYLKLSGVRQSPFRIKLTNVLKRNGLDVYLQPGTEIEYKNNGYEISLSRGRLKFGGLVSRDSLSLEKIVYISDKRVVIPEMSDGNLMAKQGSFYLEDTYSNYKEALTAIEMSQMPYLGLSLEQRKTSLGRRIFVKPDEGVTYSIPLSKASSGVQSSSAVHIIATYYARHYDLVKSMNSTIFNYLAGNDSLSEFKAETNIGAFPGKRINLFVEEPELSLFPDNQKGFLEYLVQLCNIEHNVPVEMNLTFATHSPYMLSTLNVLMLGARAASINEQRSAEIVNAASMLDVSQVTAWEVKDGTVKTLIDSETGMIDGTWLDSASDVVENQINALYDIIYG